MVSFNKNSIIKYVVCGMDPDFVDFNYLRKQDAVTVVECVRDSNLKLSGTTFSCVSHQKQSLGMRLQWEPMQSYPRSTTP